MAAIGQLKTQALFLKNTPSNSDTGGTFDNFVSVATTWGELKKRSGFRGRDAGEIVLGSTHRFECRADSRVILDTSLKVRINSRDYTIDSFDEVEGRVIFYLKSIT